MNQTHPHTAIFIFSRNAAAEASSKHLAPRGMGENLALIRKMNSETERIARATGLPVFRIDGELRSGESFGDKLYSAFLRVFQAGYLNVIGIGNDCPALSSRRLLIAARHLEKNAFVLGPAKDGGVYLIGAQKEAITRVSFTGLPWKTSRLFEKMLVEWAAFRVHFLPLANDLDTALDLYRFLTGTHANAFKKALATVLASPKAFGDFAVYKLQKAAFFPKISSRGPPVAT